MLVGVEWNSWQADRIAIVFQAVLVIGRNEVAQHMFRARAGDDRDISDHTACEDDLETVIAIGVVGSADAARTIVLDAEKHEGGARDAGLIDTRVHLHPVADAFASPRAELVHGADGGRYEPEQCGDDGNDVLGIVEPVHVPTPPQTLRDSANSLSCWLPFSRE
ncbi:hypothetical protein GCM10010191_01410 [Actinomadura vinacea]|uniref:Uncharacterized protein n=1 Tax=Actinomadura vinacea TaxID=115336 RepID=A0ABN3IAL3_9ACTN